jgi:uncharacterized protein (UPF0335 family)
MFQTRCSYNNANEIIERIERIERMKFQINEKVNILIK